MDKLGKKLLLFDVYGSLLTEKQRQAMSLAYNEDLSLGEIAAMQGISRQAVFDAIRRGEELLESYDEKLGLVARGSLEQAAYRELCLAEANADWQLVANARKKLAALSSDDK